MIERAAKFYLRYQGMKGTPKQIAQLIRTTPAEAILRMASERGWVDTDGYRLVGTCWEAAS